MKFFPIVFLLAVVCLTVAGEVAHPESPRPRPPRPPGPPPKETTTTSTTTTTLKPVTTTTVWPTTTRNKHEKTTTTTSSTTTSSTTTTKVPTTTSPKETTSTTATSSSTRPSPTTFNPTAQTTTITASPTVTCTAVALTEISESPCGTCTLLTSKSGTIESLHFPNDYGVYDSNDAYISCLYTIKASPGHKIRLTFSTFTVEKNFDFITVYDGMPPSGTILAENITGYVVPPKPLKTVTTNQLAVIFNADQNNAGIPLRNRPAKWQAKFTVVP